MDDAEFIETSVRLQLGQVLERRLTQTPEARSQALAGSSGSAVAWNWTEGRPYPENGWGLETGADGLDGLINENRFVNRNKAQGSLREILAAGVQSDVIVDMQDRRLRNIALPDGSLFPIFTFNREIGSVGRILWPLPTYYDLGSPVFLGPRDWNRVPWAKKENRIAWRGIHGGRADRHGEVRREGLRLKPLMRKFNKGQISEDEAREHLDHFPRHRLMQRYIDDPRFDIGFTGAIQNVPLEEYPFTRALTRPRLSQQAMLHYKYLLVLRGADVGSSFYWTMNSGSLALVMESYFETFASGHFRPWEHYVPFKADLSDFEERIDWCQTHDAECAEMTVRAQDMCRWLARGDLRDQIAREVVTRVDRRIADCAALF